MDWIEWEWDGICMEWIGVYTSIILSLNSVHGRVRHGYTHLYIPLWIRARASTSARERANKQKLTGETTRLVGTIIPLPVMPRHGVLFRLFPRLLFPSVLFWQHSPMLPRSKKISMFFSIRWYTAIIYVRHPKNNLVQKVLKYVG